ncbi:tyrosine-type recombinase/integrase [Clostridium perfringens]|uniref:tyrosine-type recombinase/integrase n=1 Tax=Clostridium perfringens TaxID=1502 RepID=UPI002AC7E313|nr:tyrosine-type recombinase/integrase [Clostridium perfringens]MDZ4954507.1 tyrosine-type recombinase/integrase [Clostridium perfringens]
MDTRVGNTEVNVYDIKTKKKIERNTVDGPIKKYLDLRDIVDNRNTLLSVLDEDRFKSIRVETRDIANNKVTTHYVVDDGLPVFQVNEFLDTKNDSENTRRKYSNIMSRFLNYLNGRNLHYLDANNNVVEDYIKFRIYGGDTNLTLLKSTINFKTIMDDISVIKAFYKWLTRRYNRLNISFYTEKRRNKSGFLYAEIGSMDYDSIVSKHLHSLGESREYIKWYTEEQIEALLSNLRTKRDKAIFLCTLDGGMRIDEVISIQRKDYNIQKQCITPSRTKSKKLRTVKLSKETCDMIEDYLRGEREDAEYNSNRISSYLFININKGPTQGKPVGYHNFLKILKRAAKRAGLPGDQIRTHSGRSSKAMEYLKVQARHPELNLTDAQIATNMGWANIDTIKHYKDHQNEELGLMAQEKINMIKSNGKSEDEV